MSIILIFINFRFLAGPSVLAVDNPREIMVKFRKRHN
jgi:hypothetical protein